MVIQRKDYQLRSRKPKPRAYSLPQRRLLLLRPTSLSLLAHLLPPIHTSPPPISRCLYRRPHRPHIPHCRPRRPLGVTRRICLLVRRPRSRASLLLGHCTRPRCPNKACSLLLSSFRQGPTTCLGPPLPSMRTAIIANTSRNSGRHRQVPYNRTLISPCPPRRMRCQLSPR